MLVRISCDVNTMDAAGDFHLRRIAKECIHYGGCARTPLLPLRLPSTPKTVQP